MPFVRVLALIGTLLALSAGIGRIWPAHAQAPPSVASVVAVCGTPNTPYAAGTTAPITVDVNGNLCGGSASGSGTVVMVPSAAATSGITPIVSTALENAHVLKNTNGNLYSVYASNLTGGAAGFLLIFNAISAPADGAVTPLVCVPFSGGLASANYQGLPPAVFSTGITAVISSATTCFTKTTGVLTGFISGLVK